MKRSVLFKLIAVLLAVFMLLPCAAGLAQPTGMKDAAAPEEDAAPQRTSNEDMPKISFKATGETDGYLSAALNAEGGDIDFFVPDEAYTIYGGDDGIIDRIITVPCLPFSVTAIDDRYVAVNTYQGMQYDYVVEDYMYNVPSAVAANVYMSEGSELRFEYRLSSEMFDFCVLLINGEPAPGFAFGPGYFHEILDNGYRVYGSVDWTEYSWTAPADGEYELCWAYIPDDMISVGYDSFWIDNVELSGVVPPPQPQLTLEEAMNAPGCTLEYWNEFECGGEPVPWFATTLDGVVCARSCEHPSYYPDDLDLFQSYIEAEVEMNAGDTISFDYKISSEERDDYFLFNIPGVPGFLIEATGIEDWQSFSYTVTEAGTYTFRWTYRQEDDSWEGDDCVYIRNVAITEGGGPSVELSELAQAMNAPGCTLEYWNEFECGGEPVPWFATTLDGVVCARSCEHPSYYPDDLDLFQSYIEAEVEMNAGDTISFDYKISSEERDDYFLFNIPGVPGFLIEATGIEDWQSFSYTATEAGTYTFRWTYRQEDDSWEGDDCVYIRNVAVNHAKTKEDDLPATLEEAMFSPDFDWNGWELDPFGWSPTVFEGLPCGVSKSDWTEGQHDLSSLCMLYNGRTWEGDVITFDYYVDVSASDYGEFWFEVHPGPVYQYVETENRVWHSFSYTLQESDYCCFNFLYFLREVDPNSNNCVYVRNVNITHAPGFIPEPTPEPTPIPIEMPELIPGRTDGFIDAELGEAISGSVGLTAKNDAGSPWTVQNGYAEGEGDSSIETELYLYAGTEIGFDYMLAGGSFTAKLINRYDGTVTEMLTANSDCGWTSMSCETEESAPYILVFEHEGEGTACLRGLELTVKHMEDEPSSASALNAALNVQGGELEFETHGAYQFVSCKDEESGRTVARATNLGETATECVISTNVYLDEDTVLAFDLLNLGIYTSDEYSSCYLIVQGEGISVRKGFNSVNAYFPYAIAVNMACDEAGNPTDAQDVAIYVPEPGNYEIKWVYCMDFSQCTAEACECMLDDVRMIDLNETHDYDGLIYGDRWQGTSWIGMDVEEQSFEPVYMAPNGYNLLSGAYCPEDGNIYGCAYFGAFSNQFGTRNAVIDANSLVCCQFDLQTLIWRPLDELPVGMTYSIADHTMYAISYSGRLYTVTTDIYQTMTELGTVTRGIPTGTHFLNLASDNWGNLYTVGVNGILYKIDPNTLKAREIGYTGLENPDEYFGSLYYENVKNKLYMSFTDDSNGGGIYEINTRTAEATLVMDNVGQVTSMFTYTPADFEPGPEPPEFLPGDVNQDGSITAADALLAMRYAMGLIDLTPEQLELAEMNGDGTVTAADALIILRMAMGLV